MAMIVMSIDTNTRQSTLTVDGELVPAVACYVSKGIDFDGDPFLDLRYVTEVSQGNGIVERREFFLMPEDKSDNSDSIYANKLQSRILNNNENFQDSYHNIKVSADIHKFLKDKKLD